MPVPERAELGVAARLAFLRGRRNFTKASGRPAGTNLEMKGPRPGNIDVFRLDAD